VYGTLVSWLQSENRRSVEALRGEEAAAYLNSWQTRVVLAFHSSSIAWHTCRREGRLWVPGHELV
jgi:hypothetical protein